MPVKLLALFALLTLFVAPAFGQTGLGSGIGSTAGMAANVNLTGTDTISLSGGNQKLTLTANETLTIQEGTIPATVSATNQYQTTFEICQNATGNFTLAFAAGTGVTNLYWSGGSQPGYTLTASNGDWYTCAYDGTNLRCREVVSNVPC